MRCSLGRKQERGKLSSTHNEKGHTAVEKSIVSSAIILSVELLSYGCEFYDKPFDEGGLYQKPRTGAGKAAPDHVINIYPKPYQHD